VAKRSACRTLVVRSNQRFEGPKTALQFCGRLTPTSL